MKQCDKKMKFVISFLKNHENSGKRNRNDNDDVGNYAYYCSIYGYNYLFLAMQNRAITLLKT